VIYLWRRVETWSVRTFGDSKKRDHIGPLKHLALEAVEAQAPDAGLDEFADCLILVFDAARRRGLSYESLEEIALAKMTINEGRRWLPAKNGEPAQRERPAETSRRCCTGPGMSPWPCPECGEGGR
jgi:hypothetical protein